MPDTRILRAPAAIATALVTGLVVGAATSSLQAVLPAAVEPLANSGLPWTLAGMVVVYALRRTGAAAGLLGILTLAAEVTGYYGTTGSRGFSASTTALTLWFTAAVVVGAVAGFASGLLRDTSPARRLAGLAVPAGILVGEGLHLAVGTGRAELMPYGIGSVVIGAVGGLAGVAFLGRTWTQRTAGLAGIAVVAAAVFVAYDAAGSVFL